MPVTVTLTHDYAAPADRLWDVATDWDCLKTAMKGLVVYEGLPDAPLAEGQRIETRVSLFGLLPAFDYVMEILRFDPAERVVQSHEHGGAVTRWDHTLTVSPTPGGSRLSDKIVIEAGPMTWAYVLWAKFIYRRRHKPRLEMLGLN